MNRRMLFILLAAMLAVSTAPILARYLEAIPAVIIAFGRMAAASAILWGWSMFSPVKTTVDSRTLPVRTMIAGVFLGLHFNLFFLAIKFTTIANATFITALTPVITVLVERFIQRRHVSLVMGSGIALSLIGGLIISNGPLHITHGAGLGNLFALGAAAAMSITLLIAEKERQHISTLRYTRILYLTAAVTLLIIALLQGAAFIGYSAAGYVGLLAMAAVPTIMGHSLLYYSVRFIRPAVVAMFPLGEPVIASILAWLLFGELITGSVILGGAFLLAGIIVVSMSRVRNPN